MIDDSASANCRTFGKLRKLRDSHPRVSPPKRFARKRVLETHSVRLLVVGSQERFYVLGRKLRIIHITIFLDW